MAKLVKGNVCIMEHARLRNSSNSKQVLGNQVRNGTWTTTCKLTSSQV